MTPRQIILVQQTWEQLKAHTDAVAALFYNRLFELDPSLRALFKSDMRAQGRKLTSMISAAVAALERIEALVPAVQELGRRHVRHGVRDEHYAIVGAALLDTLALGLEAGFTPEVKEAWTQTGRRPTLSLRRR